MAKCKDCGCRYDKTETEDRLWNECGFYDDEAFDGRCFDCAVAMFQGYHDRDPRAEIDDMSEEELDEFHNEINEFKGLWLFRRKRR